MAMEDHFEKYMQARKDVIQLGLDEKDALTKAQGASTHLEWVRSKQKAAREKLLEALRTLPRILQNDVAGVLGKLADDEARALAKTETVPA